MESSVHSFKLTVRRIYGQIYDTLKTIENFQPGSEVTVRDVGDLGDLDLDDQNIDMFNVGKKFKIDLRDMDYLSWQRDLAADLEILELLILMVGDITPQYDSKLNELIRVIEHKIENPINRDNKKILIFTAFSDTAEYLYENVSKFVKTKFGLNSALITGNIEGRTTIPGFRNDMNNILTCFSPLSKEKTLVLPQDKLAKDLLTDDGVVFISIDDNELENAEKICNEIFGKGNHIATLAVQLNPRGRHLDKFVARTHEAILIYGKNIQLTSTMGGVQKEGHMIEEYNREDSFGKFRMLGLRNRNQSFNPITRPNLYYPLYVNPQNGEVSLVQDGVFCDEVWPDAPDGTKTCWTWAKFIIVQLPEETDEKSEAFKAGYQNICEIGKERIRRAGKKILEDKPELAGKLDTGFRVLKVDSTNMQDVYYHPGEITQTELFALADNIKPDRTPEDLLFQVMLDLGILLSSKIEEIAIGGKRVFNVAEGYLLACFDSNITGEVITEIAKRKPYYAVFRDSSLASDSVAANFEQIFATYSPSTERKVL